MRPHHSLCFAALVAARGLRMLAAGNRCRSAPLTRLKAAAGAVVWRRVIAASARHRSRRPSFRGRYSAPPPSCGYRGPGIDPTRSAPLRRQHARRHPPPRSWRAHRDYSDCGIEAVRRSRPALRAGGAPLPPSIVAVFTTPWWCAGRAHDPRLKARRGDTRAGSAADWSSRHCGESCLSVNAVLMRTYRRNPASPRSASRRSRSRRTAMPSQPQRRAHRSTSRPSASRMVTDPIRLFEFPICTVAAASF